MHLIEEACVTCRTELAVGADEGIPWGVSMAIEEHIEQLENLIVSGRVPGTSRCLVNVEKFTEALQAIRGNLPEEMANAESVLRQKESIIKQAELEARRIRTYADEEATTIRESAEENARGATEAAEQRAKRLIEDREVVKAADKRAEEIVAEAEERAKEIVAQAENDAQSKLGEVDDRIAGILQKAEQDVAERKRGADDYAREVLFNLEERVAETLGQVRRGIDILDANMAAGASSGSNTNGLGAA